MEQNTSGLRCVAKLQ